LPYFTDKVRKNIKNHEKNIENITSDINSQDKELKDLALEYVKKFSSSDFNEESALKVSKKIESIEALRERLASELKTKHSLSSIDSFINNKEVNEIAALKQNLLSYIESEPNILHFFVEALLKDKIAKEVKIKNDQIQPACEF
jgi:hypothetical protein